MTQMLLPMFPAGVTYINPLLAVECRDDYVCYFNGMMPVFRHHQDDYRSFLMIVSQFYATGAVTQAEVVRAFGVPSIALKRASKIYREKGPPGFFEPPKKGGGPRVLKPEVLERAQELLDAGMSLSDTASELNIKYDTLYRALKGGKVKKNT